MSNTVLTPIVAASTTQQSFDCHETISAQHDVLWKIERGIVRTLTWNEDGTTVILGYWGPGDIVGSALSRVVPYQIDCLTAVETTFLPPELWNQSLGAMFLHVQQLEEILQIAKIRTVEQRLWQFLLWLAQKFGREVDKGQLLDLPLTHRELAEAIGTTRVSVTRTLKQFEIEGLLLRHKRRLVLLDSLKRQPK